MKFYQINFYFSSNYYANCSGCTNDNNNQSPEVEKSRVFIDTLERDVNIPEVPEELSPFLQLSRKSFLL